MNSLPSAMPENNISIGHYVLAVSGVAAALLNLLLIIAMVKSKQRMKECAKLIQWITVVYFLCGCAEQPIMTYVFIMGNANCPVSGVYLTGAWHMAAYRVEITMEMCLAIDRAIAITWPLRHLTFNASKVAYMCLLFATVLGIIDLVFFVTGKPWTDIAESCVNGAVMSDAYRFIMHQVCDVLTYVVLTIADIVFFIGLRKRWALDNSETKRSNKAIFWVLVSTNLMLASAIIASAVSAETRVLEVYKLPSAPSFLGHCNEIFTFFIYALRHPAIRGAFGDLKKSILKEKSSAVTAVDRR